MGPCIWQILGKEYSLGEGRETSWEGSAAKRPGSSVGIKERKAGGHGAVGKVKLNISNSNLQRGRESVSYNEPHQLTPVISVYRESKFGEFAFPQRLFG